MAALKVGMPSPRNNHTLTSLWLQIYSIGSHSAILIYKMLTLNLGVDPSVFDDAF